jgi:RNA polymerase sigma-70 factor (ECF subfamily)
MSRPASSTYAQPNTEVVVPESVVVDSAAKHAPAPLTNGSIDPSHWADLLLRTFNEVRDELVSTLCFVLGNQEDAQDVAQDVFLRCWRTRDGLPEVQNLRAWIFRVGLNAAKDVQRSAWRRRVKPLIGAEIMPCADVPTAAADFEDRECLERLREALKVLRPEEKEVFLMRQNGELTYEQIAEASERPVGTVKTQMRSALQKLKKALGS